MSAIASAVAPLACVASCRAGLARTRKDARLAAVLSEFGYRTYAGGGDEDEPWLDDETELVVCDVVSPSADLPVEVALASMHGIAVLVLVPHGVPVEGLAADLLAGCNATLLRYEGVEPHRVLHASLLAA